MKAKKWDFFIKEYEDYTLPEESSLFETDMGKVVNCSSCGNRLNCGESYTSKSIHNKFGLGYSVCYSCYKEEINLEKKYRTININNYEKLKQDLERDIEKAEYMGKGEGKIFIEKIKWIVDRANHYGEKLNSNWEDILESWEKDRTYWYMNYYQEGNQPKITEDKVKVFETVEELLKAIGEKEFRCPNCNGISSNPYECNSGIEVNGKICDWKVYGLFKDLGKGVNVYCKDKLKGELIFMPISWEKQI